MFFQISELAHRILLLAVATLLLVVLTGTYGVVIGQTSDSNTASEPVRLTLVEVFVRSNSQYSDATRSFLTKLERERGGLQVVYFDVEQDKRALARLKELSKNHGIRSPGVPSIHLSNRMLVGWKDEQTTGRWIRDCLTIEVFTRDGCPRCAQLKTFLATIKKRYPGYRFEIYEIVQNVAARTRFEQLCREHRVQVPNLPGVCLCGEMIVGYLSDETTGRRITSLLDSVTVEPSPKPKSPPKAEAAPKIGNRRVVPTFQSVVLAVMFRALLELPKTPPQNSDSNPADDAPFTPLDDSESGRDPLPETGDGPDESEASASLPSTEPAQRESIDVPLLGRLNVRELGLPVFTFLIGLVDGFNPCAMWVLLFVLSLLVNLEDRRKILAVAGTFVLVSGLAYFAFMSAWLNIFLLIGIVRYVQIGLGLCAVVVGVIHVKDFFAFHTGPSLSIPDSAKPGIYALVRRIVMAPHLFAAVTGAAVLAVLVNMIELLCTAGLPALYTQILTLQQLPRWQNYAYLALYQVAYMFDDAVMLSIVVVTLSRRKLQERGGRWLKLLSGAVILVLGLLMLFRPDWLI